MALLENAEGSLKEYRASMSAFKLAFEIAGLPKMTNSFKRAHWIHTHKERTKWKKLVAHAVALQFKPAQPLTSAALCLTRVSSAEPDFDGLVSGFKAVVDGLVECGVIATDKQSCIGQPAYKWERGQKGKGKIKVEVVERITPKEAA